MDVGDYARNGALFIERRDNHQQRARAATLSYGIEWSPGQSAATLRALIQ